MRTFPSRDNDKDLRDFLWCPFILTTWEGGVGCQYEEVNRHRLMFDFGTYPNEPQSPE